MRLIIFPKAVYKVKLLHYMDKKRLLASDIFPNSRVPSGKWEQEMLDPGRGELA